jgi:hypothetical protein
MMTLKLGSKMRTIAFAQSNPLDFAEPLSILSKAREEFTMLKLSAQKAMMQDGLDRSGFIFQMTEKNAQIDRAIFLLREAQKEQD